MKLLEQARRLRVPMPPVLNTPYANTISLADQPPFPGNLDTEAKLSGIIRWNALAMVVRANRVNSDLGGTMRLGEQKALLKSGSKVEKIYGSSFVGERHRHRYEVNNELLSSIENGGLMMSATSEDEGLCEVVELEDHPWFLGCQFHPEFTSTPIKGHPLFNGFIAAAIENISKK